MKVLAVIPARGGSQGLPGKNLRPCAGRPLIAWSIEAALAAKLVDAVIVSSDSQEVLDVSRSWGAEPLLRPAELATATAPTDPVLVHAAQSPIAALELNYRPDLVVLLQPTVPVRRPGLVDDCIQRLINTHADSVFTAYPLHFVWWQEAPGYTYTVTTGLAAPPAWRSQCPRRPRRQDMHARELMYHEDGSVYVVRTPYLLEHGARIGGHVEVVETERTVDVDTARDLRLAEALLLATREDLGQAASA